MQGSGAWAACVTSPAYWRGPQVDGGEAVGRCGGASGQPFGACSGPGLTAVSGLGGQRALPATSASVGKICRSTASSAATGRAAPAAACPGGPGAVGVGVERGGVVRGSQRPASVGVRSGAAGEAGRVGDRFGGQAGRRAGRGALASVVAAGVGGRRFCRGFRVRGLVLAAWLHPASGVEFAGEAPFEGSRPRLAGVSARNPTEPLAGATGSRIGDRGQGRSGHDVVLVRMQTSAISKPRARRAWRRSPSVAIAELLGGVFVREPLFPLGFLAGLQALVAVRQGVESLHLVALIHPFLLACSVRWRVGDDRCCWLMASSELAEKGAEIAPGVGADAVARRLDEAGLIFLAIFHQQGEFSSTACSLAISSPSFRAASSIRLLARSSRGCRGTAQSSSRSFGVNGRGRESLGRAHEDLTGRGRVMGLVPKRAWRAFHCRFVIRSRRCCWRKARGWGTATAWSSTGSEPAW